MLPAAKDNAYQVRLPVFEGPLDMLLQLIEREKLDISTVSLAQVTDQFLEHLHALETIQPDVLADFVAMAARLVWIKSRLLLPQAIPDDEESEIDSAEALARQLREYKRFKEAAGALRVIEELGQHTYARVAPPPELERHLEQGGVTLNDLLTAAQSAFAALPMPEVPAGIAVTPFTLTIADQMRLIQRTTVGGRPVKFRALLQSAHSRVEIIVTLLAVLELIKRRQVNVAQDRLFDEIVITPVGEVQVTEGDPAENVDA